MRRLMGAIPFLLALGAVPAVATSAYYNIDFTLTSGTTLPTSGSFYYDASTSTFTGFDVLWDGVTFDLTSQANSPQNFVIPTDPCYSGATNGAQVIFDELTTCASDANPTYYTGPPIWFASADPAPGSGPANLASFDFFTQPEGNNLIGACPSAGCSDDNPSTGGFVAVETPEPGTWALMLLGLGLTMIKRMTSASCDRRNVDVERRADSSTKTIGQVNISLET